MANSLLGQLVSLTLDDGQGGEFKIYGRLTGEQELSVTSHAERGSEYLYTATPDEAARDATLRPATTWLVITSETGGDLPAPSGSRGQWGGQVRDAAFKLATEDYILSLYQLRVRADYALPRLEPIGPEGEAWIQANLTSQRREDILLDKLEAIEPALRSELDELLSLVRSEARMGYI